MVRLVWLREKKKKKEKQRERVVYFSFFFFFQAGQSAALSSFRVGKWCFTGIKVCFHKSAKNPVYRG